MTNFNEIWKTYLNEDLLIESRFTDALAYAQNFNKGAKQWKVKDVVDQMSEEQVATLKKGVERAIEYAKEGDPSGDNKYLMWVARFVRKDIMRRLQKYGKQWSTTPVLWNDPDAVKDSIHDPDYVTNNIASLIVDNVIGLVEPIKNYHLLKQRGIIKKDIYDFDPTNQIGDFKGAVEIGLRQLKDKEAKVALKKQAAGEADDLLETEDYAVIRPNTEGASCYYGWGTRWCISARESRNYFNQYSGEGKSFYFVMFRHLPNSSPYKKVALVYGKDQGYETDPEQVFDALDEETGEVGLIEAITENLLYRVFHKSDVFEKTRNKIRGLKNDEDRDERLNDMKDMIARMIEDPTEDDIPNETVLKVANYLFPDTYSEVIDLEIQPLQEKFDELIQETYGDITGNAAYHNEENPAGPKGEDYMKLFDQYAPFTNIYVNYDEYDTNSWYWDASFQIEVEDPHFKDLQIPEDVDIDEFADVIHKAIDGSGIYPDEVEPDGYDMSARVRLTPDYDEQNGLEGFERFLDRMRDIDEILGSDNFWEELSTSLMDSGLTAGGLKELSDRLDEIEFKNIEYGMEGKVFTVVLEVDPVLARPEGISGLYFGRMINTFTGGQLAGPKLGDPEVGSAPSLAPFKATNIANAIGEDTLSKIEDVIRNKYEDYYKQLTLPGLGPDASAEEPLEALPLIDMEFAPRPDKIDLRTPGTEKIPFASKERGKGGAGINIEYPYNFVLTLTNEDYWATVGVDEDELAALVTFLKWIDQDEVKDKIEALLQGTLNDAVLQYMKDNPQQSAQDLEKRGAATHFADVEDKPQVAEQLDELYKRWGKMIK